MGGGANYDKIQMWQNRAAGAVDKAIAKEKRQKADGTWREPKKPKHVHPDDMSFKDRWPTFTKWYMHMEETTTYNGTWLSELRDYHGMNGPQEPYRWVESLYNKEMAPKTAYLYIKDKLGW